MIDVQYCLIVYVIYGAEDMSTQSVLKSNDYGELYKEYSWFSNTYPAVIQQACDEFFFEGFQFILLGISKNINTLMDKDSYFVTKVRIDKMHDMFFRLSESTISIILDKILGRPNGKFNLNKLTDLEAKIITSFNDYVYNSIAKYFTPPLPVLKRTNYDVIHLTFLVKDKEMKTSGKFIVTLPEILLSPEKIVTKAIKFNEEDFASSLVDVQIKIGATKLKLIEIKNLGTGDIVVFDNSDTHKMLLKFKDFEKEVKLNPNMGLVIPFNNNEGEVNMAENTNLWDSIEVEMDAKFDTVKISLGELKNIEEGLVVDLTSIYDNRVTLSVEEKPIARGELVIVNDRYGVKIDEVVADIDREEQEEESENIENFAEDDNFDEEQVEEPVEEQAETSENNEEDEFDYSDFELEDEDI